MADDDSKSIEETEREEISSSGSDSGSVSKGDKKKRSGILSRIWNWVFRLRGADDFEKRLQYITKEEAAVVARMKRRSNSWRRMSRHLIVFSVILEVIAIVYAIMTRSGDLDWKMRAFRVLPMFLLPALSSAAYSALSNFNRMCDRKDQKNLERLRAERQAKIDELKEKTNYYTTQQLIQKYDPDPAAKAAAATVLASKLGVESGLKVFVGDESKQSAATGKSNDIEQIQSNGLRNRKQSHSSSTSAGSMVTNPADEQTARAAASGEEVFEQNQLVVDHYQPQGSAANDGGWLARVAALLVGEDPTQSFALICGNCHMHNGLARKEDFPHITYYCPHCHALNRPEQLKEHSGATSLDTSMKAGVSDETSAKRASRNLSESVVTDSTSVKPESERDELKER